MLGLFVWNLQRYKEIEMSKKYAAATVVLSATKKNKQIKCGQVFSVPVQSWDFEKETGLLWKQIS